MLSLKLYQPVAVSVNLSCLLVPVDSAGEPKIGLVLAVVVKELQRSTSPRDCCER